MSPSLTSGALWVLAATATAMLPMRRQYVPGIMLLVVAPVLLAWIGWQHGGWIVGLTTLAFLSMFRNPLMYMGRRVMGKPVILPKEDA